MSKQAKSTPCAECGATKGHKIQCRIGIEKAAASSRARIKRMMKNPSREAALTAEVRALREQVEKLESQRDNWRVSSVCREYRAQRDELLVALEHYADAETLTVPDDWDYPGMGGGPDVSQFERRDIGDVARAAITRCRQSATAPPADDQNA